MSQRIDGPGIHPGVLGGNQQATEGKQASGTLNGMVVVPQADAAAMLKDAAEELTFAASETQESKIKDRKLKREDNSLDKLAHVLQILQKMQDVNKADLDGFLAALKSGATSPQQLKEVLKQFEDPTHQHMALVYAKDSLQSEGYAEWIDIIDDAITELMETRGAEVRAGYNIAGVELADVLGNEAAHRGLYRGTVLDYPSFAKAFDDLSAKYGANGFPKAVDYLVRALSADMASTTPSTSMKELKTIVDDLYQLQVLSNYYSKMERLIENVGERFHGVMPTARDIVSPVLRLKDERMILSSQVLHMMPFLVTDNPEKDVLLSQGMRDLTRSDLPHKIFSEPQQRVNLLDAMQEVVDAAIDREDQMLEE
ncbi:MAG: type III secretion system gatekeeper subunit SctW [Desulfovibrionales bacterium]|nr:type III secretion system gatekeeper subunit SctW [Desulfovibrionales bacterium]